MSWSGNHLNPHSAFTNAGRGEQQQQQQQQQNFANFLYENDFDYNYYYNHHPFPGVEGSEMMKKSSSSRGSIHEKPRVANSAVGGAAINYDQEISRQRKTRLTSEQLDALERSFQEEIKLERPGEDPKKKKIKLEPERKMWLARELGLHPRQVAIWFQNRRARLKGKQLERLYDSLKQDFEIICKQNLNLKREVMRLKAKLDENSTLDHEKQGSTEYMEVSNGVEEKVMESSSSVAIGCSNSCIQGSSSAGQIGGVGSYFFSIDPMDDYYSTNSIPYWVVSPGSTYPEA